MNYHVEFDYNDDQECYEECGEIVLTEKEIEEHITKVLTDPFMVEVTNVKVTKIEKENN